MSSFRYQPVSDSQFDIVGRDEVRLATVERGDDGRWRIVPEPDWAGHDGYSLGPFGTSEEAFEELDAVSDDQS